MSARLPVVGLPCDHRMLADHPFDMVGEKYIAAVRDGGLRVQEGARETVDRLPVRHHPGPLGAPVLVVIALNGPAPIAAAAPHDTCGSVDLSATCSAGTAAPPIFPRAKAACQRSLSSWLPRHAHSGSTAGAPFSPALARAEAASTRTGIGCLASSAAVNAETAEGPARSKTRTANSRAPSLASFKRSATTGTAGAGGASSVSSSARAASRTCSSVSSSFARSVIK